MAGGSDHSHDGHGHGSDEHGSEQIIPHGSWQDRLLALVALAALGGLVWWGSMFNAGITVPQHSSGAHSEHASGHAEHAGVKSAGEASHADSDQEVHDHEENGEEREGSHIE